ncbi:hypothetical protein AMK59_2619 [Oryctes borbonicus]|uniref:LRRCT domain-containing protein n=1 Tax=Oryctes borbonicus TaxID=1629725 RepID=A0A0T6BFG4_9SCAR|nr:hypothetical protein AMK59_2619 [Oryctes borbonicus]
MFNFERTTNTMHLKILTLITLVWFQYNSFAYELVKNFSCANQEKFKVSITNLQSGTYVTTVNGCLTDTEAYFVELGRGVHAVPKGTFVNMINLKTITLQNHNLGELAPGFILNAPKLQEIYASNNFIKSIKRGVFNGMNLTRLLMNSNRIYRIEEGALANMNIARLDLANNQLTRIRSDWFENVFINELDLSYNKITTIEKNVFDRISNLTTLNLNYNSISFIPIGSFSNQQDLKKLYLAGNELKEVDFLDITLDALDVGFNQISYLPFKNWTKINDIMIYPNPWDCKCLLEFWKYAWKSKIRYGPSTTSKVSTETGEIPQCFSTQQQNCSYSYNRELVRKYFFHVKYNKFGTYVYNQW